MPKRDAEARPRPPGPAARRRRRGFGPRRDYLSDRAAFGFVWIIDADEIQHARRMVEGDMLEQDRAQRKE
jgi:hypothetical protein